MLLSTPALTINPAVYAEAELFTDGAITDAVLHRVAGMRDLALYVARPTIAGPSAADLAARAVVTAEAAAREARRCFEGACRRLGEANRRVRTSRYLPPVTLSAERVRLNKSAAMAFLNTRRAALCRADRDLASTRAALAALAP